MTWVHRLSDIDPIAQTATCAHCGPVRVSRLKLKSGKPSWRCRTAKYANFGAGGRRYRKHKKDHCENCSDVPEYEFMLEVHHVDGNRKNNAKANLQTLCVLCHRKLTYLGWM